MSSHNIKAKSHILTLLGEELIGSDSLAIFELVKNAYDADADIVNIKFENLNTPNQKIIIEDDGHGMSKEILEEVWLTIGTDFKRGLNRKESEKYGRVSFGNKGVGRLAVHKLAKIITLETKVVKKPMSRLEINWQELIESKDYIQELSVDIEDIKDDEYEFPFESGTIITLSKLVSNHWTKKAFRDLARKIQNISNPFKGVDNFKVNITCNDFHQEWIEDIKSSYDILKESLYQFNFSLRKFGKEELNFAQFRWSYFFNPPSQLGIERRKIRMKPISEGPKNSNLFHIGELFKDIEKEGLHNKYLRNCDLNNIGSIKGKFFVFNLNSEIINKSFGGQVTAVKNFIKENNGVKIFRDNIRVYNYGEPFDDWLNLDLDKIQRTGDHFGKKVTIGVVEIVLKNSINGLIEKTNREGFIDNNTYSKFTLMVKETFRFFERESSKDKEEIIGLIEKLKPVKKIGFGQTILELETKLKEKNLEKELMPLLKRVDKDYTEMRDIMVNSGLAGLNLGIAFHEVDREMRFINKDLNQENFDILEIKKRVRNLVQLLESLSPILRQNKSISSSAVNIVDRAIKLNNTRFEYHKIILSSSLISIENQNFAFKGPTNLLISSISNILDNAIYWVTSKRDLEKENTSYKPAIFIGSDLTTFDGPAIIIADNGNGFSLEPEELTQPFRTQKESGMGLGLYFADLVMNMIGGKLIFPDPSDLEIPFGYKGACLALVFPKK